MAKGPSDCSDNVQDLFKEEFKRYKKTCASDLIDFRTPERFGDELTEFAAAIGEPTGGRFGLRPPHEWKLYRLHSTPGLIVVPNPFLAGGQLHWVARCLIDYPCNPNICNLDAHIVRNGEGRLWPKVNASVTEGASWALDDEGIADRDEERRTLKRVKVSKEEIVSKDSDLYRLRWVTLGYHYDWNTKEYHRDRWSAFPNDLGDMAAFILNICGFPKFSAEAGIVNYYHMDSTLSGHTDHSEKDLARPLLSLSFGQSAIFLIGGATKQTRPKAVLLNSGDVVIMSRESRLAYHGVPKVLPYFKEGDIALKSDRQSILWPECLLKPEFGTRSCCGFKTAEMAAVNQSNAVETCDEIEKRGCSCCEELIKTWQLLESYISVSRINVNIRQVVSENCTF